ncbi:MAG: VWA domain-containing protein [Candidatus Methanomethylophilus sp.]|jgi:magnesium chelatase subunit D|nr:VWA domain-containing protein [Methanomethylophilus sp.]
MHQDVLRNLPFSAVRGMSLAKKALMCAAVDDSVKGVLIKGPSGTGKSLLVRAFAEVLPGRDIINVPQNINDDQLFGGLDLEKAVSEGRATVSGGLLGRADGNLIYVDNANLMDGRTLDSLMECVESGKVILEREGVSAEYSVETSAIASMDPSERDIPESTADRFEMCVNIIPEKDVCKRAEIVLADMDLSKDISAFYEIYREGDADAAEAIQSARNILPSVVLERDDVIAIVKICRELNVRGHRGDISAAKVSKALAALGGRTRVSDSDISDALVLCLPHRRPSKMEKDEADAETVVLTEAEVEDIIREEETAPEVQVPAAGCAGEKREPEEVADTIPSDAPPSAVSRYDAIYERTKEALDEIEELEAFRLHEIAGIRSKRAPLSMRNSGRYRGFRIPRGKTSDPAFDATVRAAAPFQTIRRSKGLSIKIEPQDIREKIRTRRKSCSFIFAVDVSGSLVKGGMMGVVQDAIRSMLMESYVKRDRVALVTFRERAAEVAVPFTRSVELICDTLEQAPVGGSTPLASALIVSRDYAVNYLRKHPGEKCYVILITDGCATLPAFPCADPAGEVKRIAAAMKDPNIEWTVINSGKVYDVKRKDDARRLAEHLDGRYIDIKDLGEY